MDSLKRLYLLAFFILTSINLYANSNPDQQKISLNLRNVTLSQVFETIEDQTGFKFFYKNDDIDSNRKISIQVKDRSLNYVLSKLFDATSITYSISERRVILKRNNTVRVFQQRREVLGRVIETKTKAPIVFATIRIKNSKLGVIADEEGYFRLPYRYKQRRDTIVITAIGYKRREVSLWNLKDQEINSINIDVQTEGLELVEINAKKGKRKKQLTARQIVRKAIENIPINYPTTSHSLVGYYRDYKLLDNEYLNLNEGIVESFDGGFQTHKINSPTNQSLLYSYNLNENFKRNKLLDIPYDNDKRKYVKSATLSPLGGNELLILNIHDPIRYYENFSFSFVEVLKKNFVKNHLFKLIRKTYVNDTPIYEIEFNASEVATGTQHKANGKIYIESSNYKIYKIEYEGFQAKAGGLEYTGYNGFKNLNDKDYRPFYNLKLEYRPVNDKMYLNYISFSNRFRLGSSANFKIEDIFYEEKENAFFIELNSPVPYRVAFNSRHGNNIKVPPNSKEDYSFKYKNIVLNVLDVEVIGKDINDLDGILLKVTLEKEALPEGVSKNKEVLKHLKYKIHNLTDVFGRELNDTQILDVFQFREFFVQEVFPNKTLPKNIEFVDKTKNLSESSITDSKGALKYWVNTPLKEIKQ